MLNFRKDQTLLNLLEKFEHDKSSFDARLKAINSKIEQLAKSIEATSFELAHGQMMHQSYTNITTNPTTNN